MYVSYHKFYTYASAIPRTSRPIVEPEAKLNAVRRGVTHSFITSTLTA
jgi:hypothetical protein